MEWKCFIVECRSRVVSLLLKCAGKKMQKLYYALFILAQYLGCLSDSYIALF